MIQTMCMARSLQVEKVDHIRVQCARRIWNILVNRGHYRHRMLHNMDCGRKKWVLRPGSAPTAAAAASDDVTTSTSTCLSPFVSPLTLRKNLTFSCRLQLPEMSDPDLFDPEMAREEAPTLPDQVGRNYQGRAGDHHQGIPYVSIYSNIKIP